MSFFSIAFFSFKFLWRGKQIHPALMLGQLPPTGEVIATVNGNTIHQSTVDAILKQFPADRIEEFKASGGMEQMKEQLTHRFSHQEISIGHSQTR